MYIPFWLVVSPSVAQKRVNICNRLETSLSLSLTLTKASKPPSFFLPSLFLPSPSNHTLSREPQPKPLFRLIYSLHPILTCTAFVWE